MRMRQIMMSVTVAAALIVLATPTRPASAGEQRQQVMAEHGDGKQTVNSAHRLLFWVAAHDVATLSDQELDQWKSRGVGGFICMTQHLKGMGGTQDYTGAKDADLSRKGYETQRSL